MSRQILGDRYEIEDRLGAGGMATVYRGTDRELDRSVAVKVLHPRYSEDPQFVARFRREARAAAALNHPNVVSVYDTGTTDGTRYIVMEYVEGQTLTELLAAEGELSPERATEIAEAVCLGLRSAHTGGLVHRDVKPGNIMITDDGRVKVMDFGIARAATADTLTQTAMVMGTAAYLSPEQAMGETVDARSDIYSLGCVLYEMITGRPPFKGDNALVVAGKHVRETPEPPARDRPGLSPALEAVILRALAKDPAERHQSADELRADLRRAVGDPTVPVARPRDTAVLPETLTETAPFWRRPRLRPWLMGAAVVAVMAVIAAVLLMGDGDELLTPPQRQRAQEAGGGPPAQQEEQTPEGQPSPVQSAYLRLVREVDNGVASSDITADLGSRIRDRADRALAEFNEGEPDKAAEELGRAHEELSKAQERGEADPARADAIHAAIDDLATAMGVEAPREEEGGEDEDSGGPGKSDEPPGKAKGQDD